MQSQVTVRVPDDLNKEISALAKRLRLKRSDVIRMALENFVKSSYIGEEESPYQRVKALVGSISSGVPDLGERHREYLLRRVKKHA